MKGERKKEEGEEGQCRVHFPTVCLHYFVKLHFLTRRSLRDDYQSADTNPADLKLLFNMISKQVLNVNYRQVRDPVLNRHIALFTQIDINQIQLSDGRLINCVSTRAPV